MTIISIVKILTLCFICSLSRKHCKDNINNLYRYSIYFYRLSIYNKRFSIYLYRYSIKNHRFKCAKVYSSLTL